MISVITEVWDHFYVLFIFIFIFLQLMLDEAGRHSEL